MNTFTHGIRQNLKNISPGSLPFILMHLAALSVFFVPFSFKWVALAIGSYVIRMFGITAGYHRYFAHRTYKLNRFWQFVMAVLGVSAIQKGPLWWAAHHRSHHRHSDQPQDIHSPVQRGFWWSHMGWIMSTEYDETDLKLIPDFAKYKELIWLNNHYLVVPVLLAISMYVLGGAPALSWGFFLSSVFLWHGTFTINSLSHVFGTRRYATSDDSRNNPLLALITLGEGWHNNHHCYMSSTRQGFFWYELDVSYLALKALSWVKVVREIREPPLKHLREKEIGFPHVEQKKAVA